MVENGQSAIIINGGYPRMSMSVSHEIYVHVHAIIITTPVQIACTLHANPALFILRASSLAVRINKMKISKPALTCLLVTSTLLRRPLNSTHVRATARIISMHEGCDFVRYFPQWRGGSVKLVRNESYAFAFTVSTVITRYR